MLILSRKQGQKLIINDNIEITILDNGCGNIKLGINAPAGVKIYREEIYTAVKEANVESNKSTAKALEKLNEITTTENSIVESFGQ